MHGNVFEWCQDWFSDQLPGGNTIDPAGPAAGSLRVIRGGHFEDLAMNCRSALRTDFFPFNWNRYIGFRVVLASDQP